MALFRRPRLFKPSGVNSEGKVEFGVRLAPEARQWIVGLADELEQVLEVETSSTTRLFPTAYPNDPELDAGYQILARQQLIDSRREAIELLKGSANNDRVTEAELGAWMGVINDLRLVLGTQLDVSEDDHEIELDDPNFDAKIIYAQLGLVLTEIVDALTTALPEAEDD